MLENNKYWFAVCVGDDDDDLGMGSFDYQEAFEMACTFVFRDGRKYDEIIIKTVDDDDAFVLDEETIDFHGIKWGELEEWKQDILLEGCFAVDGVTGNQVTEDGECIVDLFVYPFSVAGEIVDGNIEIKDDAYIYNSEKGVIL